MRKNRSRSCKAGCLALLLSAATVLGTMAPNMTYAGQTDMSGSESASSGRETVATLTADNKDCPYVLDEDEENSSSAEESSSAEAEENSSSEAAAQAAQSVDESSGQVTDSQGQKAGQMLKTPAKVSKENADASEPEAENKQDIVTVTITKDSGFEEGSKASIGRLRAGSKTEEDLTQSLSKTSELKSADVKFTDGFVIEIADKDGKTLAFDQNNEKESITVSLTSSKDSLPSGKDTELWHQKEDGTWEKLSFETIKADENNKNNYDIVRFTTTSFSPFVFANVTVAAADEDGTRQQGYVTEIKDETSAQFVRGADEQDDGTYLWTAKNSAEGHKFIFNVNIALSGVYDLTNVVSKNEDGTYKPGDFVLRIRKHVLKNRSGEYDDTYDLPVPSLDDALASDQDQLDQDKVFFAYYEDGDDLVITNRTAISSGYLFGTGRILRAVFFVRKNISGSGLIF